MILLYTAGILCIAVGFSVCVAYPFGAMINPEKYKLAQVRDVVIIAGFISLTGLCLLVVTYINGYRPPG